MMTPDRAGNEPELEPVARLLVEAAGWEPDTPAPEGLAARALAEELEQQAAAERRRSEQVRVGLFGGLFLGASAVSASVAFAFLRLSPSPVAATHPAPPAMDRLAARPGPGAGPAATGPRQAEAATVPGTAVAAVTPRPAPRNGGQSRRVRRRRRSVRGSGIRTWRPVMATAARVAEAPAAVWREEKVRHEVAGVLSAGWLLHEDPESGALVVSPGILDLPALAQTTSVTCEGPDTLEMFAVPVPVGAGPSEAEAPASGIEPADGPGAAQPEPSPEVQPASPSDPSAPIP